MNNIKYIIVNDGAAEPRSKAALPRFNGPKAQFKVQCGFAAVQWAFGPVQGSRFNAALPRFNGPLARFKVQGSRFKVALNCGGVALNFEL